MIALSLHQPWASLWCSPAKIHETRAWRLTTRGTIAVHAAKTRAHLYDDSELARICTDFLGAGWDLALPFGALIGTVDIVAAIPTLDEHDMPCAANDIDLACGNFGPDRFAFKRGNYRVFKQPIPFRGYQGPFNVSNELIMTTP
jgi:hypothetical protein